MTFSVLFTFTDFQLIYVLTRGGPINATHLMATLSLPARHLRRRPRRGRGHRRRHDPVPARRDPVQLFRAAAAALAAGGERLMAQTSPTHAARGDEGGMSYLESLPRRVVTVYLPLAVFVFVLLFPFYWMAITAVKPNDQLTDYKNFSPFWVVRADARPHRVPPVRDLLSRLAVEHDRHLGRGDVPVAAGRGPRRLRDRAPALPGRALCRPRDLPRLSGAALDPVHPAGGDGVQARALRHAASR